MRNQQSNTFKFLFFLAVASPALAMVAWQSADITDYPYMASILIGDQEENTLWCSGVIVSKQWVLTTGTCAWISPPIDMMIVVGSNEGQVGNGTVYTVAEAKWHPKLNPDIYYYQYGLLKINGEFQWSKSVQQATFPTKNIKLGTEMTVVGFAWDDDSSQYSVGFNLKKGTMNWISANKCVHNDSSSETQVGFSNIPQKKTLVCAYNKGKTSLCATEYGSAYVKDGVVYGQFIEGDTTDEHLDVYCTNSSYPEAASIIKPAVSWIKQIIASSED